MRASFSIMNLPERPACQLVPQAMIFTCLKAANSAGAMSISSRKMRPVSWPTRPRVVSRTARGCSKISLSMKGGYQHFMLKEIFEQPRAVRDTTLGRVGQETGRIFLDEMDITPAEFAAFKQVKIIACGTSWHAGLSGKFMIEKLARIPCEVDYGSEFRYRDPIILADTLTIVISQSGETADT